MNADNRELRTILQKLDDIDTRLESHERTSQMTFILVAVLGTVALFLLGFLVARA
jgi:hypothetical protein